MMASLAAITTEVDSETLALVDRLARDKGMTGAEFAAEAIRRVAESEADFHAFLKVGVDAIERGDVIPHDKVMADLDDMIERHKARC